MPAFNANEPVTVDGQEYRLAIDISVIDALEDEFDCSFDELLAKVGAGKVRIGKMARLMRGLLSKHHPDLSLQDVADLVFADIDAFVKAMEKLFVKAWPAAEPAKVKNPPKARRGTGANSSANGAL